MTDEEMNKTIADCLGIVTSDKWGPLYRTPKGVVRDCPDFCNDLNAMHGAEITLRGDRWDRYAQHLRDVVRANRRYFLIVSTATQRAEAFLRTIGKWRGE